MDFATTEQFVHAIQTLNDIYAEVEENQSKYLVHAKCTKYESVLITCTDITDGCWERELFYDDVISMRKQAGSVHESWDEWCRLIREAFQADNLFVALDDDYEMQLTIWYYVDGKQVEFQLSMPSMEKSDMNQRVTEIVFTLLSQARRNPNNRPNDIRMGGKQALKDEYPSQSQREFSSTQSGPSSGHTESFSSSTNGFTQHGVDTTVVRRLNNTKVQAKKRKPGFSLVNPRVKRWHGDKGASIVAKGAKIAPPAAGSNPSINNNSQQV